MNKDFNSSMNQIAETWGSTYGGGSVDVDIWIDLSQNPRGKSFSIKGKLSLIKLFWSDYPSKWTFLWKSRSFLRGLFSDEIKYSKWPEGLADQIVVNGSFARLLSSLEEGSEAVVIEKKKKLRESAIECIDLLEETRLKKMGSS